MAAKKSSLAAAQAATANDKTKSAAANALTALKASAAVADAVQPKNGLDLGSIVKTKMVVTPKLIKKDDTGNSLKIRKNNGKYYLLY